MDTQLTKRLIAPLPALLILVSIFFSLLFSCKKDTNDIPGGGTDSTILKDYLVLRGKKKITSPLPGVGAGTMKINIRDSMFTMKGQAYTARVSILHKPEQRIAGFNIAYSDHKDDFYYEVPAEEWESNDSVSVVYIGLQASVVDTEISYPYTETIRIQPFDENNFPLDEFERTITLEDPASTTKKPLWDEDMVWQWIYTAHWDYQHATIRQVDAPGFNAYFEDTNTGYPYASCCAEGIHFRVGDRMGAYGYCDSLNQYYRKIQVTMPNSTIGYIFLTLYQNGNFMHHSSFTNYIFEPAKSSCNNAVIHTIKNTNYYKAGTYTATQTGSQNGLNTGTINFTTVTSTPPFGPAPRNGVIVYTDHLLVIASGRESVSDEYYLRYGFEPVFDAEQFLKDYWWD